MREDTFREGAGFLLFVVCVFASSMIARAAGRELKIEYIAPLPPDCADGCSLQVLEGRSGWLTGRAHHLLWKTNDGGLSWREIATPGVKSAEFRYIQFLNAKEGMLLTSRELYETRDGGVHWRAIELPIFDGVIQSAWAFPQIGVAWIGGGVYQSFDGPDGPNWAMKKYESGQWGILHPVIYSLQTGKWSSQETPPCDLSIFGLKFWEKMRGFAVGDRCFYYTQSAGQNWDVGIFHTGSEDMRGYPYKDDEWPLKSPTFTFLDERNGWVSLDNNLLYITRDGGRDWYPATAAAVPYFDALQFLTAVHGLGIALGKGLYESLDGGTTWNRLKTEFPPRMLYCVDEKHCWTLSDTALYRMSWN